MSTLPLRISVVSYLNSRPFIKGLEGLEHPEHFKISHDIPALCAAKLIDHRADLGLIPVAVIPQLDYASIITDYCIAANGKVASVLLVANKPIEEIETVILDQESRTSVMLARILARDHWKISPEWKQEEENSLERPEEKTGMVIIGDRALKNRNRFKYVYDLAEEWKKMTGLPFVFACWVANKEIDAGIIKELNLLFEKGLGARAEIAKVYEHTFPETDIFHYLTENIRYSLGTKEREGLALFLKLLKGIV